jgi:uncharacterized membrane protein
MIHHPAALFIILIVIESVVLWAARQNRFQKIFRYIPAVFWIYCLPMVIASLGWIDRQSPLYGLAVTYGLPASLFLLLSGVDLKAIARLGRTAVLVFLAGSAGIMVGTMAVFAVLRPIVGDEYFSGFGALSASWMGGSANMIAVKEAAGVPDNIFLPMVVVDTVVPYVWMGFLIFLSSWQKEIDAWNGADQGILAGIRERIAGHAPSVSQNPDWIRTGAVILMAFLVSLGVNKISSVLPVVNGVISAFTWVIILVSVLGLIASLMPLRRYEPAGTAKSGYVLLYFVLTTIGAKASITHLGESLVLIAGGFLIVLVHAAVLLAVVRWLKAPVMLAAAASQANLGGAASAPIVAEVYHPGLAPLGLLMAVLGNIIGTYLGIIVGQLCRLVTLL